MSVTTRQWILVGALGLGLSAPVAVLAEDSAEGVVADGNAVQLDDDGAQAAPKRAAKKKRRARHKRKAAKARRRAAKAAKAKKRAKRAAPAPAPSEGGEGELE